MITYLYWLLLAVIIFAVLFSVGVRMGKWKPALILAVLLWLIGTGLYYFWLEQIFVKRLGGTMTVAVPEEQQHIAATWKGDNLWIENYNPETNECVFREYSRGNLLEGKVVIKNCSPLQGPGPAAASEQARSSF